MGGFRLVALGYALLVFLIAPAWLSADDEPAAPAPVAAVEESATTIEEAVPNVPEAPAATPVTEDDADEQQAEAAPDRTKTTDREPKAAPAKSEEKKPARQDEEPVAEASASASVTISDFKFTPSTVTVNEGDTVTWSNDGPTVHTATAEDGSFDTGTLRKGESGSATFTSAGTINYICSPHPYMKGQVIVQAASAGSGSGSGSGSTDDTTSTGSVAGDDASSGSAGLPDTGGEALAIALLGIATLGFGLLLRRQRGEV